MATTINNYADVQNLLNAFIGANSGLTPGQAPHGVFWSKTYQQFITDDVPNFPGYKILVVGNADNSNIIMALKGTGPFAPGGDIGLQMPQPCPPEYNTNTPMQSDVINALTDWINKGCPNNVSNESTTSYS
jgi:hypothetical protein